MATIVLETAGKHESVNYATIYVFQCQADAEAHIASVCTGKTKHWRNAEIVREGVEIELIQPTE